ncbi:MAG TPA: HAD-IIB family hydrolase [Candidatus Paceibacterota bacterium]|nr:HAD-IIB family hydrolase [Candidatus Paceibacterota bacterium]
MPYKHFFFDVDNTLTRSKSPVLPEHEQIFVAFAKRFDVIVVSGSSEKNVWGRFTDASAGTFYTLAQNGNRAFDKSRALLWERLLTDEQKKAIEAFVVLARKHTPTVVPDENDLLEDRECQMAFSFIGQHADINLKEQFDPDFSKRRKVLADLHEQVERLGTEYGLEITIGGTTNLDIYMKGFNKGYNARSVMEHYDWKADECLYTGDALFPGGNDETVVGVMETKPVKDYRETYEYLGSLL